MDDFYKDTGITTRMGTPVKPVRMPDADDWVLCEVQFPDGALENREYQLGDLRAEGGITAILDFIKAQ
jgi:hypothetical protein